MQNRFFYQKINNVCALFCKIHFVGEKGRKITKGYSGNPIANKDLNVNFRLQMMGFELQEVDS
jgi:hypothetical protein